MTLSRNNSLNTIKIRKIFVAMHESRISILFISEASPIYETNLKAWRLIHTQIHFPKTLLNKYIEGYYYHDEGT